MCRKGHLHPCLLRPTRLLLAKSCPVRLPTFVLHPLNHYHAVAIALLHLPLHPLPSTTRTTRHTRKSNANLANFSDCLVLKYLKSPTRIDTVFKINNSFEATTSLLHQSLCTRSHANLFLLPLPAFFPPDSGTVQAPIFSLLITAVVPLAAAQTVFTILTVQRLTQICLASTAAWQSPRTAALAPSL